jgi:hypothetical protein
MRSSFHVVCQCAKSKVIISNTGAPFNIRNKEHTVRRIPNHAILRGRGLSGCLGVLRGRDRGRKREEGPRSEATKPLNMQA